LWDCAHIYYTEFPEVNSWGEYEKRERLLKKILPKSIAVLTDSDKLSEELNKNYCVDNKRLIAMPFLPPKFINSEIDQDRNNNILEKMGIQKGFFLYPAMFWPHKNHIRIIHALIHLRKRWGDIDNIKVIFTGSNKGNLSYIKDEIKKNELQNNVIILNFVSQDLLNCLYLNSRALIMPTYFGQTNIPPLEAWIHGKPVIYSEHISSGIEDSVIQVDPDNEVSISDAILKVMNCSDGSKYIDIGKRAIEKQTLEIQKAEKLLLYALISFEKRRVLWDR
jgi:glycosyltransferase involved in cell wall biosynthesis